MDALAPELGNLTSDLAGAKQKWLLGKICFPDKILVTWSRQVHQCELGAFPKIDQDRRLVTLQLGLHHDALSWSLASVRANVRNRRGIKMAIRPSNNTCRAYLASRGRRTAWGEPGIAWSWNGQSSFHVTKVFEGCDSFWFVPTVQTLNTLCAFARSETWIVLVPGRTDLYHFVTSWFTRLEQTNLVNQITCGGSVKSATGKYAGTFQKSSGFVSFSPLRTISMK
jgi:hypothetical protein